MLVEPSGTRESSFVSVSVQMSESATRHLASVHFDLRLLQFQVISHGFSIFFEEVLELPLVL
jgi:hypothetical protein